MRGGVFLTIETANVESEMAPNLSSTNRPGRLVRLTVGDTGCGMAPEIQARIFEPFYTTNGADLERERGSDCQWCTASSNRAAAASRSTALRLGAGIGLSNVYFPAVAAEQVPAVATSLSNRREGHRAETETLLLVEDEDAVRTTSMMALQTWGYNVLAAASGDRGFPNPGRACRSGSNCCSPTSK